MIHKATGKSGKTYQLQKMRTAPSWLPVYHHRRDQHDPWQSLSADTLAQARRILRGGE